MTEVAIQENTTVANIALSHGECLTGHVLKPFIHQGNLHGAVLSFDGRSETALLHIRQMTGESPGSRLAELGIGDPLMVRIMVLSEDGGRKVWASEKLVGDQLLIEKFVEDRSSFRDIEAQVRDVTDFGLFVEILSGAAQGKPALIRSSSISGSAANGRVKLGSFLRFKKGDLIVADLVEAKINDGKSKLELRMDNIRPKLATA